MFGRVIRYGVGAGVVGAGVYYGGNLNLPAGVYVVGPSAVGWSAKAPDVKAEFGNGQVKAKIGDEEVHVKVLREEAKKAAPVAPAPEAPEASSSWLRGLFSPSNGAEGGQVRMETPAGPATATGGPARGLFSRGGAATVNVYGSERKSPTAGK